MGEVSAKRFLGRFLGGAVLSVAIGGLTTGCQNSNSAQQVGLTSDAAGLRALSGNERSQDFDQLLELFQSFYGPYQFKEQRFNYKIADIASGLKASALQAQTDEAFAGYVMQLGAALQDGHVQISVENTASGISRYQVPIILTPVEDKILIGDIDAKLQPQTPLAIGDEVLEVDGKAPLTYLPTILKYQSVATTISDHHMIVYLLLRPSYMTDLIPTATTVRLKVKHASGAIEAVELPWLTKKYNADLDSIARVAPASSMASLHDFRVGVAGDMNSLLGSKGVANIKQMGDVNPFFLTPQTQANFHFVKVYPSDDTRKALGLADNEKPPIFAALYKRGGKTVLLVREGSYDQDDFKPDVYLKAYQAIFAEFQDLADVLVLDQTHNPGGTYCSDFYNLFAHDGDVQAVEKTRADRMWVNDLKVIETSSDPKTAGQLDNQLAEAWGLTVESAYDKGSFFADPIPLFTGSFYAAKQKVTWNKPMLVLIDELAGSCGDIFPMLVKANKRAALFGQTTMGLGGNVEEVGVLSNSRIHIKMTRGLYYPFATDGSTAFVENAGVAPDISYTHTVSDFRAGFVGYVSTFSDKALEQIPAATSAVAAPVVAATTK